MSVRSVIALCLCAVIGLASSAFAQERTPLFPRKSDKAVTAEVKSETKNKKVVRKAGEKQKATAQRVTAKSSQKIEAPAPLPPEEVVKYGNNSELRSETQRPRSGFLAVIFGEGQELLPQTQALDDVLRQKSAKSNLAVKSEFVPQTVAFSGYPRGTIVIDTKARFLYLMEGSSKARRYAIAVGKEGLEFKGQATVGDKQEWPRWIPTLDMQKREPKKYGQYKDGMPGGPANPLGARAIYLYQGKKDTHIRIHGTNQPETIGTNSSNGCFRMINEHVMDLYDRVKKGTQVVVL